MAAEYISQGDFEDIDSFNKHCLTKKSVANEKGLQKLS